MDGRTTEDSEPIAAPSEYVRNNGRAFTIREESEERGEHKRSTQTDGIEVAAAVLPVMMVVDCMYGGGK